MPFMSLGSRDRIRIRGRLITLGTFDMGARVGLPQREEGVCQTVVIS